MHHSDSLAVGSPTLRVIAIMAATLLAIIAVPAAGQRLLAADAGAAVAADHVVAADGSGTHTTIAAAVEAAEDGESILVRDGTYAESVTISKDIELFGESRDGVIIEFGAGCRLQGESEFWWEKERVCDPGTPELDGLENTLWLRGTYALHLLDSNAHLSDLTFRHLSPGYGIYVTGGAPLIERVTYADSTIDNPNGGSNFLMRGGTSATVKHSDLGLGAFGNEEQGSATIEENVAGGVFSGAPLDEASGGPAVIRNNTLAGMIWAEGPHLIEGNEIDLGNNPFDTAGIFVAGPGSDWIVRGNIVRNSTNPTGAIDIGDLAGRGVVVDNVVEGSTVGILSSSWSTIAIEGNRVIGGSAGIQSVVGTLELVDNVVEDVSGRAFMIGGAATLTGNTACENGTDLWVGPSASVDIDASNEFCSIVDLREA